MQNYLDLLRHTLENGSVKINERTGAKTHSVVGPQLRYFLPAGFPMVTTSKKHLRSIIHELLWFIRGSTMNTELNAVGVSIWDEWAVPENILQQCPLSHYERTAAWITKREAGQVSDENVAMMLKVVDDMLATGISSPTADREGILDLILKTGFGEVVPGVVPGVQAALDDAGIPTMTSEIPLDGYGRLSIYAEENNLDIRAVAEELQGMDHLHRQWKERGATDEPAPMTGHEFLDSKGVPRGRQHIAVPKGSLGPIYGAQWRFWPDTKGERIDQLAEAIKSLRERPFSRRIIVSAWNPSYLPDETISAQENVLRGKMALAPCHAFFQFVVEPLKIDQRIKLYTDRRYPDTLHQYQVDADPILSMYAPYLGEEVPSDVMEMLLVMLNEHEIPDKRLNCVLTQRSCDLPLGCPYNISSYALLTMMVAQVVGMQAGELVMNFGDAHIYADQVEGVREQLTRKPHALPTMLINPEVREIDDFKFEDFRLIGYTADPTIKYEITV